MSHLQNAKVTKALMEQALSEMQEWIKTQPQLPQNIERMLLLRYLKTYNFRVDKAQKLLKYSFEMRAKHQNIFTNRDVTAPEMQNVREMSEIIPLLRTTPENYKVCILRMKDNSMENFNFNDNIKMFFMIADMRLIHPDPNPELPEGMADGEIPIFDMKGVTIWHVLKASLSTIRLYFKYTQECHPVRARQLHVYNCTPLFNRIMSLIKPLMKPEVAARLQFHSPDSPDSIFEFIPRDILPPEYGGTGDSIEKLRKYWNETIMNTRDYLKNDANWIVMKSNDMNNNS